MSQSPLLLCRVTENCAVFVSLKPFLQFLKALRRGAGCANPLLSIHLPVLPERSDVEQRRCLFPKKNKYQTISLRIFSVSSQVCFKLMEVISKSQRDFVYEVAIFR